MVDHVLTVAPDVALDPSRVASLANALEALGFEAQRHGHRISFASRTVEAQTAKAYLRANGFRDREFRIVLEYVRQWGIL